MAFLTSLLRSLGNTGAVDNVRADLEDRRRDDWLVATLARRLEQRDQPEPAAGSPTAGVSRAG